MRIFLTIAFELLFFSLATAQYYYDRSKNPDKTATTKSSKQDFDKYYFFNWDINKPLSNNDFISNNSTLGTRLGFRKRLNDEDKLWVGGDFAWMVYKQYIPYNTYQTNSGAISTDLYNYSYNYSLTANIDYLFLSTDHVVVPYGGLGLGLSYNKIMQYYNIYASNNGEGVGGWGLMVRPEIGLLVGFGENTSWRIKLAAHYDYSSVKSSLVSSDFIATADYQGFTNYGFQFGIVKMAW